MEALDAPREGPDRSPLHQPEIAAMGKTLPPFSQLIEYERRRWAPFKRALPKADQDAFDRLFDGAKLQVQAGVMVSRPWAFETMVMAVLLEHEKRIEEMVACLRNSRPVKSTLLKVVKQALTRYFESGVVPSHARL
jgi:hypothetical protein